MVAIPPIFTSGGKTECFHLYINLAELVASSNLYIVVSSVIQFDISSAFSGQLVGFFNHENGVEEWSPFHQYSHLVVRPSASISI